MPEFFDYDPLNGVRQEFDYDESTGNAHITSVQDVEPLLDWNAAIRNAGTDKRQIKESWWLYAKIPPIFMIKMRAKGIDCANPAHADRVYQEVNTNYPKLKCTDLNHGKKLVLIHDLGKS